MAKRIYKTVEINLHGLLENEARAKLNFELGRLAQDVQKVIVIHGYHGGKVLQNMVRNDYNHPRIDDILPTYSNQGETTYYIKKK